MLLRELAEVSRRIGATASLLDKEAALASTLRRLDPDEVEIAVAFLTGRLRQGKIGVGWAAIARAASPEGDAEPAAESGQAAYQPTLDDAVFGEAALAGEGVAALAGEGVAALAGEGATAMGGGGPLSLAAADEMLSRIAARGGRGSSAGRARLLRELFRRMDPDEREFLRRVLSGELRQGALDGVMQRGIAAAAELPLEQVQRAAMVTGDLGATARAALTEGGTGLARFHPTLFTPLAPMLAQTAETLEQAIERLGETALEYKLDGARLQIHRSGDQVRLYSRLLNDVTAALPEVVVAMRELPATSFILDGEAIVLGRSGLPQPFQVTMRRFGRRLDVERLRTELPVTPVLFDLLSLDGADWIDRPQRERFEALLGLAGRWAVPRLVTSSLAEAERFYDAALESGHEGLMAKSPASPYLAGSRGAAWLKIKPAHTLDLVVLAAEWGHGRRAGWLSNLHLGAVDPGTGRLMMLGKTFKGMTDELLAWQTRELQKIQTSRDGAVVHVRPERVVEIAFNDIQESPVYPSGMALRFARLKRYRDDKTVEEADTLDQVRAILVGQTRKRRRR